MKILILDTYYQGFLNYFWLSQSAKQGVPFGQQHKLLLSQNFGTADFYSKNFRKLGHTAQEYIVNDIFSQGSWAAQNNDYRYPLLQLAKLEFRITTHNKLINPIVDLETIVLAQVKHFSPDVIYLQHLSYLSPSCLRQLKQHTTILAGQIASQLPNKDYLKHYDVIYTSFPHFVSKLKSLGVFGEFLPIGFDPSVLNGIKPTARIYNVTFIGSFTPQHQKGTELLEKVAAQIPIHVWGRESNSLCSDSPLRHNLHGEIWGNNMYRILAQSKIVINRHIDAAGKFANNMRLFEATGMGALLITDDKSNITDYFTPGKEVVTYHNAQDLTAKINYYLNKPKKLAKIAQSGQRRTVRQHNYNRIIKILSRSLSTHLDEKNNH